MFHLNSQSCSRPRITLVATVLFFVALLAASGCERGSENESPGGYSKSDGIDGTLTITGSDTMSHLMQQWIRGFRSYYPSLTVTYSDTDSSVGARSLIDGSADLAPMSRLMLQPEIDAFIAKYGYRPTPYAVAVDAVVFYVNKQNPLQGINLEQVNAIFSKTPRHRRDNIQTWGQLDLTGQWKDAPIKLYGREATSGTYELFKIHLLDQDNFRDGIRALPTSDALVQGVAADPNSLGYSGISALMDGVRILPLAEFEYTPFVEPTSETVRTSRYPLRRYLYLYVNQQPRKVLKGKKRLPPLIREFLRYVYSPQGKQDVLKRGYFTVEDWMVEHSLSKIH